MARNVIAFITGLVVGFIVVAGIEMINYGLFPLPAGLDPSDREGMLEHVKTLPAMAYVIVLFAHISGAFFSSFVATWIADSSHKKIALGLGIFMMAMGLVNIVSIPHPMWFNILDLVIYVPFALVGYSMARKFRTG